MRASIRALISISILALLAVLAVGCGSATPEPADPVDPAASTTGGETAEPVVLRTTTPVPVPQPAIAREELPQPLQDLWTRTEEIVAERPPEPPAEATAEVLEAWAADPFLPWVDRRRAAIEEVEPLVEAIGHENHIGLSVAAALFGYMYEDTAAGIRGAPVPEEIASDRELLGVYVETLDEALHPFAQRALESYAYCATTIANLGESPWLSWGAYCLERGRDVGTVFELGVRAEGDDGATDGAAASDAGADDAT